MKDQNEKCVVSCSPINIFESTIARETYKNEDHYRSEAFDIPSGYVALIELTTHADSLKCLMFTAVRIPTANPKNCNGLNVQVYGKTYRRWRCSQSLGPDGLINNQDSDFTEYNKSIVRWGLDNLRGEIVEFEYIVRPGNYYLLGEKITNEKVIEDCSRPTFFEYTLLPISLVPDLQLPCCDPCVEVIAEAPEE